MRQCSTMNTTATVEYHMRIALIHVVLLKCVEDTKDSCMRDSRQALFDLSANSCEKVNTGSVFGQANTGRTRQ